MPDRPLRFCDVCGGLDDHPRHVIALPPDHDAAAVSQDFLDTLPTGAPVSAVALLLNPRTTIRHMDCCAAQGCEVCKATEAFHGEKRGDDLIASVLAGGSDIDTDGLTVGGISNG